jgi:hypothetical protein
MAFSERHLPLPPQAETLPLIDSYFRHFREWRATYRAGRGLMLNCPDHLTPIVHEPSIRAQVWGAMPITDKAGTRLLLYMVNV